MVKSLKKVTKKIIACVMAAAIAFSAVPGSTADAAGIGSPVTSISAQTLTGVSATMYSLKATVNTKANGTATVTKIAAAKATTVKVAGKVTVNGVTYKVTKLAANVLSNASKAKTVYLPSSITTIAKNAFKGCKSLNKICLNTKKAIIVKKGAFSNLNTKKMTIIVNKNISSAQLKKLKANLKAAGFSGTVKKAA
jgi:hypothetical protein